MIIRKIKKIVDIAFMIVILVFLLSAIVLARIFVQKRDVFQSYYLLFIVLVIGLLAVIYYLFSVKTGKTTFLEHREQSILLKDFGIALTTGGFIVAATTDGVNLNFLTGSGIVLGGLILVILSAKLSSKADIAEREHKKLLNE